MPAKSEPMPGSVMATAVMSSPEQMPGSQRSCCSGVAAWRKYGRQTSLCSPMPVADAFTPASWISSAMTWL